MRFGRGSILPRVTVDFEIPSVEINSLVELLVGCLDLDDGIVDSHWRKCASMNLYLAGMIAATWCGGLRTLVISIQNSGENELV